MRLLVMYALNLALVCAGGTAVRLLVGLQSVAFHFSTAVSLFPHLDTVEHCMRIHMQWWCMLYSRNNLCCAACSSRVSGDSRGVQRAVAGSEVTAAVCSVQ